MDELSAPSGKWVAVHSAAGPVTQAIVPGGHVIFGQRYHEIMSLPDLARVGKPVRIPSDASRSPLHPCWSADEKFVVYQDDGFWMLAVVETGL